VVSIPKLSGSSVSTRDSRVSSRRLLRKQKDRGVARKSLRRSSRFLRPLSAPKEGEGREGVALEEGEAREARQAPKGVGQDDQIPGQLRVRSVEAVSSPERFRQRVDCRAVENQPLQGNPAAQSPWAGGRKTGAPSLSSWAG